MELLNRSRTALAALLIASCVPLLAAPQHAAAQETDIKCDDQWHFASVGDPVLKREIATKFTLDNRKGSAPLEQTEKVKESLTKSFSHKVDLGYSIEAEAKADYKVFSASVKTKFTAAYGFTMTETNSVEKETEVRLTAPVGVGFTYYVGIESAEVTGYYERILDCDKKTQRYQLIGPVTEEVPVVGKAVWTEALPNSK
ncbi:ETX/MTX2 family pore-forming toxin [Kitasatospora sp. NPDC059812]|uniref:ETX/MTX2 family pore-forming toxin n=1 Tax=Kitasatospora sp. NPDC059812 TaxID=3346958 RepID=UPI0036660FF7